MARRFQRYSKSPVNHTVARGFTYLTLLIAIAVSGVGLTVMSEMWSKTSERNAKLQRQWEATQYENAIRSYYYSTPPEKRNLPRNIDVLLLDDRTAPPLRHLRKIYHGWRPVISSAGIEGFTLEAGRGETVTLNLQPTP